MKITLPSSVTKWRTEASSGCSWKARAGSVLISCIYLRRSSLFVTCANLVIYRWIWGAASEYEVYEIFHTGLEKMGDLFKAPRVVFYAMNFVYAFYCNDILVLVWRVWEKLSFALIKITSFIKLKTKDCRTFDFLGFSKKNKQLLKVFFYY